MDDSHKRKNIFQNLVINENTTTELFCNLLSFRPFLEEVLAGIVPREVISTINNDHITSQTSLGPSFGQPDITIINDTLELLLEVKIADAALTGNQPTGYYSYLQDAPGDKFKSLVFLVPLNYASAPCLRQEIDKLSTPDNKITCKIIYWEDIISILNSRGFAELNIAFRDFSSLLSERHLPPKIHFNYGELSMMFRSEADRSIPVIMEKLQQLILAVSAKLDGVKLSRSNTIEEFGFYCLNEQGETILWFGTWREYWKKSSRPLCFGVDKAWKSGVDGKFANHNSHRQNTCDTYIVSWFEDVELNRDDCVERIAAELNRQIKALS